MKLLTLIAILTTTFSVAQSITQKKEYESKPLNEILNAEIGSSIIEKGLLNVVEAIRIDYYPKQEKYLGHLINIQEGDVLLLAENHKKGKIFYDKNFTSSGKNLQGVIIVNNDYENPKLFTHNPSLHILSRKIKLKVTKTEENIFCSECIKQQFIYNGKSGNILKFIYREFVNDMARPAFTQELQYDLNDGNIIGFKGLRIEVLKTSNIDIEYKIIKYFD